MCDGFFNPAQMRFLWKHRGDKNYRLKALILNGAFIEYIVLEDSRNYQEVLGKIVTAPGEGEAYHWPRLQHENLAPLITTVSINEKISVYILPLMDSNLTKAIHANEFMNDSECFNRKRAYTEDILYALDYLHNKSLCLLNLTELIIFICCKSDKAVICEFSHLFLIERATKEKVQLPALYQAPELETEYFDPVSAETWACGVMLLQMFTKHYLPSGFIGEEVHQVLQAVKEINYDIVKEANQGAEIDSSMVEELKVFLDCFLKEDPKQRIKVSDAVASSFLRDTRRHVVKDGLSPKFGPIVEHPWGPCRKNQINSEFKNKISETFRDIYLKEIADCRAKLKKLPCTNKFINLDFVPAGDSIPNNAVENQCSKHVKSSDVRMDWIRKNVLAKGETMHLPELPSGQNSKDLATNDKANLEHSECMEDDSTLENKIDFINLKQNAPNLSSTENTLTDKSKTDNNPSDIKKNEYDIKSLSSTAGGNELQYLDSKSKSSSNTNSMDSMESSDNTDEREQWIAQNSLNVSKSSSNANFSMDSMESSGNIDEKEQLFVQNSVNVQNLTLQEDKYICNKETEETTVCEKEITCSTSITHSKSEILERNPNLCSKSGATRNFSNSHFWQSDPSIECSKNTEENVAVLPLSSESSFYIHCNESHSEKTTIPDNTTPNENLTDDISTDYSFESCTIKTSQNENQSSEAFALKCSELPITNSCEFGDTVSYTNQRNSPKHEVKSDLLTVRRLSSNDMYKSEKNFSDNENKMSPIKKLAHQKQIRSHFFRRDSYKQAISQGFKNNTPEGTNTLTRENLIAEGVKSPKREFINVASSSTKNDKAEINCIYKKNEDILPIRDILIDQSNAPPLEHSTLDPMANYSSEESAGADSLDTTKKSKKKKKTWIYYLCPGSRWKAKCPNKSTKKWHKVP